MTGAIIGTTSTFTNAGSGVGVEITNSSTGDGLKINHSSGRALNIASSGSGFGIIINNSTGSTSAPFTIQKQGSNVITLSDNGAANFSGQLTLGSTITNGTNTFTLPSATGTLALTSALSGYLPLTGGTLTGALSGTSATFSGGGEFGNSVIIKSGNFLYLNNAANTRVGSLGTTGDGTELSSHNGAGEPLFLKAPHTTAKILFITNGDNTTGLRMTLNASGNLSLGNTNDTYKLDVTGTGRFTTTSTNPALLVTLPANANATILQAFSSNAGFGWKLQQDEVSTGDFRIFRRESSVDYQVLNLARSTGAATFSSSVTATGGFYLPSGGAGTSPTLAYNNSLSFGLNASGGNAGIYFGNLYNSDYSTSMQFRVVNSGGTNVTAMTISPSGNVGIGTSSPALAKLVIEKSGSQFPGLCINNTTSDEATIRFKSTHDANSDYKIGASILVGSAFEIYSVAAAVSRMVITSGGNVGIGTTSPFTKFHVSAGYGLVNNGYSWAVFNSASNGFAAQFGAADDVAFANTGNNAIISAAGSNAILFGTNSTERMRITSGGNVLVGNTSSRGYMFEVNSNTSTYAMEIRQNTSTGSNWALTVTHEATSGTRNMITFNSGGYGQAGSITSNNTSTSYNTSSDYRLKQDFKDFNGLDLVSKLKAYDYEWKADKTRSYGVIAHELQSVINYAVTGVKDGKDMQGVDYSKIVPVLIKAIQELNDKIK
jgi:hypothetical protein